MGQQSFILHSPRPKTLPELPSGKIHFEESLEDALSLHPDAVIIANPTASHMETALAAAENGAHLFIEKPISHSLKGIDELHRICIEKQLVVQSGFQFRFHPGLNIVKKWLLEERIGPLIHVESHWGEYLPSWHPWEDYRKGYSARHDLGGGVLLTLCHPLDYIRWLIGEIAEVSAMLGYRSGLEIDTEDTAQILLRFENDVLGNVHLNYCEYPQRHFITIIGQEGRIDWRPDGPAILKDAMGRESSSFHLPKDFTRNQMFKDELQHFIRCIDENITPDCTLDDGIAGLKIAIAAKKAAREKRTILLSSELRVAEPIECRKG